MTRPTFVDIAGQRFGAWLVQRRGPNDRQGRARWYCRCDCGADGLVTAQNLRRGASRRCRACAGRMTRQSIALTRYRETLVRVPKAAPRCDRRVDWDRIGGDVLDLAEAGVSRREIAIRYGLSKNAVVGWLSRNADLIGFHHREPHLLPLDVPDHFAPGRTPR